MSNTNDNTTQKVRIFFAKISWKKILTFLFFLMLSSIFWVMQVYRQNFEATIALPIQYLHIPDSIVFEQKLPSTINVRIKDDFGSLVKYYFTRKNDSIKIDVRDLIYESDKRIIQGTNMELLIREQLALSSELISYSPSRIVYSFDAMHQKRLPVIYNGHISLTPGFMIVGDLSLLPDSVYAYGSKAALDTMVYAYTVSDTIRGVNSTRTIRANLVKTAGVRFKPNVVELTIPVDGFNEKEVEVAIVCVNLPANMDVKFFPSSVRIPFSVGLKRFDEINKDHFHVIVDYNDILGLPNRKSIIPVRITESPDFVRTKLPIPSEVQFALEMK